MHYIQRKGDGYLDTVDEFSSFKECKAMIKEYRTSDSSATFYTSTRACNDWSK